MLAADKYFICNSYHASGGCVSITSSSVVVVVVVVEVVVMILVFVVFILVDISQIDGVKIRSNFCLIVVVVQIH